jgi:hypothetical protein
VFIDDPLAVGTEKAIAEMWTQLEKHVLLKREGKFNNDEATRYLGKEYTRTEKRFCCEHDRKLCAKCT